MILDIEEMMMISVWVWWTYYVMRSIDFRFHNRRWLKERAMERELIDQQKEEFKKKSEELYEGPPRTIN
tara:strand:- start:48 stop:254 length:207 start_codon:yes stop_codon:yes gene_type:complete